MRKKQNFLLKIIFVFDPKIFISISQRIVDFYLLRLEFKHLQQSYDRVCHDFTIKFSLYLAFFRNCLVHFSSKRVAARKAREKRKKIERTRGEMYFRMRSMSIFEY